MNVPFHRPQITDDEIRAVADVLRSGWLTTGPKAKEFETRFAAFSGCPYALALNSATAALHLSLDAIGLKRGEAVLVPTMTFAASAEVVRYFDATPLLFDCRPDDMNPDYAAAEAVLLEAKKRGTPVRAIIAVHYGGLIGDMARLLEVARRHDLRIIEDAAHCGPSLYRPTPQSEWLSPGAESDVACYSFYANKCMTTGEGGMAVTRDAAIASRMRMMSLHGISRDAWKRFSAEGSWYYEILLPGYKYNLTDIAAAMGVVQLAKAEAMRAAREQVAAQYRARLQTVEQITLPTKKPERVHAWHLFAIQLKPGRLRISRAEFIAALKARGVLCSVHWIPLHLHPYYRDTFGYSPEQLPIATSLGERLVSLPIYPDLSEAEIEHVCASIREVIESNLA